jgi:hypothetical protein
MVGVLSLYDSIKAKLLKEVAHILDVLMCLLDVKVGGLASFTDLIILSVADQPCNRESRFEITAIHDVFSGPIGILTFIFGLFFNRS